MTNQEKFEYWLETAQYDLETANAMLSSGRLLYVAFMCQQAIEKLVKGLYLLYLDDDIPRIHAIRTLFKRFESLISEPIREEHYALFDKLSEYYLEGRYTDYKKKLSANLTKREAERILMQSREAFAWLLTLKT